MKIIFYKNWYKDKQLLLYLKVKLNNKSELYII